VTGPPNVIRIIKLRGMRWVGHAALMKETTAYRTLVGKPSWKTSLRKLGADRRIILKWILKNDGVSFWFGFILFLIRTSGELL
jgi:hypothetical protein